jgi:hypothetical protein
LQDSLDGSVLAAGGHLGLKHDTEGSIAHDLALGIGDLLVLARQAILDLFADDLCAGKEEKTSVNTDQRAQLTTIDDLPPMRKLGNNPGRFCDISGRVWDVLL